MPADRLPDIEQRLTGDSSPLIKELAKAEAAEESFARTSKKTSDSVGRDQKDSEKAFTDFDRLLRSKLKDDETALGGFQRELTNAKTRVTDLRTQLLKSSGPESTGLFQDLKQAESDLKGLEHLGEDLIPGFSQAGSKSSKSFFKSFTSGLSDLAGTVGDNPMTVALVAAAVAAAPPIIAVLGSAITTAFGAGTIAVGIMGAAHDPRVSSAFGQLKTEASDIFAGVTAPLIEPVLAGIRDLQTDLAGAAPGLKTMFASLATVTRPLIDGFGGFVTKMLPGFESGMKGAEPLLQDLARLLPWLGQQIGTMFDEFGHGGPGARLALQGMISEIGNIAVGLGKAYQVASNFFLKFDEGLADVLSVSAGAARVMANVPGWLGGDPKMFTQLADNLANYRDELRVSIAAAKDASTVTGQQTQAWNLFSSVTARAVQGLQDIVAAENQWISTSQAADDSNLQMHQAMSAFNTELLKGKHAWDLNYAAGQHNVGLLDQLNESITHHYDDLLKLHPANKTLLQDELNAEVALYNQAKAAGASNDELATIKGTISDLRTQLGLLNGTSATVNVHANFDSNVPDVARHIGKTLYFEHGGVVHADQGLASGVLAPSDPGTLMVLAGERRTKGEVFMPLAGISKNRAMGLAQVAGDAYGFDAVPRGRMAMAGGGSAPIVVHNHTHVYLDGKEIHTNQIKHAQRYKARNGSTGLT